MTKKPIKIGNEVREVNPSHMRALRTFDRFGAPLQVAVFWLSLLLCLLLLVFLIATTQRPPLIIYEGSSIRGTETTKSLPIESTTLKNGPGREESGK